MIMTIFILAMKNIDVWGTPDFKSDSSTVAATSVFDKIHSVSMK